MTVTMKQHQQLQLQLQRQQWLKKQHQQDLLNLCNAILKWQRTVYPANVSISSRRAGPQTQTTGTEGRSPQLQSANPSKLDLQECELETSGKGLCQSSNPAKLDWVAISGILRDTHGTIIDPADCRQLWKAIAYQKNSADPYAANYDSDEVRKLILVRPFRSVCVRIQYELNRTSVPLIYFSGNCRWQCTSTYNSSNWLSYACYISHFCD